jgi:hypothetical protein
MKNSMLLAFTLALSSSMAFAMKPTTVETQDYARSKTMKLTIKPEQQNVFDLLFVIDDSGSMYSHQQAIKAAGTEVISALKKNFNNSRIAVITTTNAKFFGARKTVISTADADAQVQFENNVLVGEVGEPEEKVFDNLYQSLSTPLIDNENSGFLRPQSHLGVIIVTDADDQSKMTTSLKTANFLNSLKGPGNVTTVGFLASDKACQSNGEGMEPVKIRELLQMTNGKEFNLCKDSIAKSLETALTGINLSFSLTVDLPVKPVVTTIKVLLAGAPLVAGDIYRGWTYDSRKNQIVLGQEIQLVDPKNSLLEIEFEY